MQSTLSWRVVRQRRTFIGLALRGDVQRQTQMPELTAEQATSSPAPIGMPTLGRGHLRAGLAAETLLGAVLLGAAGDYLLRGVPWGFGFTSWMLLWLVFSAMLVWHRDRQLRPSVAAFLILATGFAGCVAWRDAEVLTAWNVLGGLLSMGFAVLASHDDALPRAPLAQYVRYLAWSAGSALFGSVVLAIEEAERHRQHPRSRSRRWRPAVIGIVVSLPLLLVFGGLLGSADPVFERLLNALFDWNLPRLIGHVALFGFVAWLVAGIARALLLPLSNGVFEFKERPALGTVEITIPLGLLAALFLAFDAIQARSFFGGDALIRATIGLSYAEYARQGFFQLVAVSGLILPVLLAADWAVPPEDPRGIRLVRWLSGIVLVLIGLIVASAVWRMRLYINAYGLTDDRVYASTVMVWIVVTLAWFAITVLRGCRAQFAFGGAVAGLAALVGLNVLNPERLVARVNIDRAAASAVQLDAGYLARLGADAVPLLVSSLDRLDASDACDLLTKLESKRTSWDESLQDWRRWNVGRTNAAHALSSLLSRDCTTHEGE